MVFNPYFNIEQNRMTVDSGKLNYGRSNSNLIATASFSIR